MRRLRSTTSSVLLAPLCIGLLTTYAVAPASAVPAPNAASAAAGADPTPAPPAASTNAAEQALQVATALLTDVADTALEAAPALEGVEPTEALLDLRNRLDELDPADRRQAERLFARPDNGVQDGPIQYTEAEKTALQHHCTSSYCIHYVPAGTPGSKATVNSTQLAETIAAMDRVYEVEIGQLGYRTPISDDTRGNPGLLDPSGLLDVYLANTGSIGAYGYAVPEDNDPNHIVSPAYLVLDNDYAEFGGGPTSPQGLRQVTAAHEFFHVVQYAYDSWEDSWLMESTATWMEERVYDNVNDSRQYLGYGPLRRSWLPVDLFQDGGLAHYGSWAFHERYTQALGNDVVRQVWNYAAAGGRNYRSALNQALLNRGWSTAHAYKVFAQGQLAPSLSWEEGAAFPAAQPSQSWQLSRSTRSTGWRGVRLSHLAGRVYGFRPASGLVGRWKLRLQVDAPNTGGTAYVGVYFTDGSVRRLAIPLRADGTGSTSVPFSARNVRRVALNVGNATYSDGRLTRFRATAWR